MEHLIRADQALKEYLEAAAVYKQAQEELEAKLAEVYANAGTCMLLLNDKYYQVRKRGTKLFMCEMDERPKGRPKKTKSPQQ